MEEKQLREGFDTGLDKIRREIKSRFELTYFLESVVPIGNSHTLTVLMALAKIVSGGQTGVDCGAQIAMKRGYLRDWGMR